MDSHLLQMQNEFAVRLEALFDRFPALCGFTIQDCAVPEAPEALDEGLVIVDDLSVFPVVGAAQRAAICDGIAQTVIDFLVERPAAQDLLRGRTIVRVLH